MAKHEIKRNDTRPYWPVTLNYEDGTVADLTGATIRFLATDVSTNLLTIDTDAVVTDATAGKCEWQPTADQTAIAGAYAVEWEVTFADTTTQTWPTRDYDRLEIIGDLG